MKRDLLTLAMLALGVTTMSAQTLASNLKASKLHKVAAPKEAKLIGFEKNFNGVAGPSTTFGFSQVAKNFKAPKKATSLNVYYMLPTNAYYRGNEPEGAYNLGIFYTPAFQPETFEGGANDGQQAIRDGFSWSFPTYDETGNQIGDSVYSTETTLTRDSLFGLYEAPTLTVKSGNLTGSYTLGNTVGNYGFIPHYWYAGTDTIVNLSSGDPSAGYYQGFQGGLSVTAPSKASFYNTGKKAIGFVQTFGNPNDTVQVSDIYMASINQSGKTLAQALGNNTLTATVATISSEGQLVPFATATATSEDVENNGGQDYTLFKFKENDPVLGEVESPVILPKEDFAVIITGFENLSDSVTCLFSGANGFAGNGYVLLEDGSLSTIGYSNEPSIPQINLCIGFHGAIPVANLMNESNVVTFPTAGGAGETDVLGVSETDYVVGIYSLSNEDSWQVDEIPDWVSATPDFSYLSRGIVLYRFTAEALPSSQSYRVGDIVISTYGKQVKLNAAQGDVPAGINGVNATANVKASDNRIFNLAGQQVTKAYKGIVISNGKKYIQK